MALGKINELNTCKYAIDVQDYQTIHSKGLKLNVLHLNIRSFVKNRDNLLMLLEDLTQNNINIDVILLCETYLTEINHDLIELPHYKSSHRYRKHKQGGGVSIFVKDQHEVLDQLITPFSDIFESLFLTVKIKNVVFCIGEVDRVPNSNISNFLDELKCLIENIKIPNVIIGTDQNVNLLHVDSFKPASDLLELLMTRNFLPNITLPTRVTFSTSSLIDNIYVKNQKVYEIFFTCAKE